jgi:PPOX class probable F420-dependent enzyme
MSAMPDEVRDLLSRRNFAHLATVMPDGSPHSVPLWVGLEGDRVVMFTQSFTRKARNIEQDGRVALSVEDRDDPYLQCDLRGRVVERREGPAALEVVHRLAVQYTGERFPWEPPTTIAYVIEIERSHHLKLPFAHGPA